MKLWLVLLISTVVSCTAAVIQEGEDTRSVERNPSSWFNDMIESLRDESKTEDLKTMEYYWPSCRREGQSCRTTCDCCGPTSSCDSDLDECFYTTSSRSLTCYGKVMACGMQPEAYCPGEDEPWEWWTTWDGYTMRNF